MTKKRHNRKKRRQWHAKLRFGRAAAPTHTLRSGRTGTAHSKKTPKQHKGPRESRWVLVSGLYVRVK